MSSAEHAASARLANDAWESLFRAQARLLRSFAADDVWHPAKLSEYDVLYALTKHPQGASITELGESVMLTQPALSRLIERLLSRGWVTRERMPADARRVRVALTDEGRSVQRAIGARHARRVAERMTSALNDDELRTLRELSRRLVQTAPTRADSHKSSSDQHSETQN